MQPRLDYWKMEPKLMNSLLAFNKDVEDSGLEKSLVHLVKLRASQINGCAYCVDMHTNEARKDGESEQRLYLVAAWRESPLYSGRERAAFAWTDRLTRLADGEVDDALYAEMLEHFSESEIVKLTLLIGVINSWNRVAVPFRSVHPVRRETQSAA
ncbi:carboxymuconolactone decarboxylase family protein [Mesorhizobium xinjiangense]|uniref:carboxymuconolactone decarboxylase family protein n=1 Tax=Mesorhizobium xinjiangense TaxID=2678685 RepID=UPI0012EE9915|nr:carboxymuconolactone decarboxylase family protein [Mesorhizobium xinjiangense]